MELLSSNFELRYISSKKEANGETDFKGRTSTLNTEQRVDFLSAYADRMEKQYEDFSLDEPIVTIEEARDRLKCIKPQPKPSIRKRIQLDEWKWIGYGAEGVYRRSEISGNAINIPAQTWRCMVQLNNNHKEERTAVEIRLGEAVVFGFEEDKSWYYYADHRRFQISEMQNWNVLKVELDFVYKKWNLYVDDRLLCDFVDFSDRNVQEIVCVTANASIEALFSKVWGVGYYPNIASKYEPFFIETFIDADFEKECSICNWTGSNADERGWETAVLPISHGGERYAGQDIYMRKKVYIDKLSDYAELYVESLTPGGEIYINSKLVRQITDEVWHKIDVTGFLKEGENILAVKVYADKVKECDKMTHTHTDLYTGWFAGRIHLDLLPEIYIEDVYSYTKQIEEKKAVQAVEVTVKARRGVPTAKTVKHKVITRMRPWFPCEGEVCSIGCWDTLTNPNMSEVSCGWLEIQNPKLWTPKTPNLYEIVVELEDEAGAVVDDYVVTTGIRMVSQEGGIFRINGKPELLRAPLLFGARPPLDKIAAWEKCPPAEYYIQEMLMVQRMNGNGFRMSVHDERMGGINDPRICELADQMGIMLVWQTTAWLRITSAYNLDYEEMQKCIRQVRNHASIVIWQPLNHPSWKNWDMIMRVYRMMHEAISAVDKSRLISPAADSRRMRPRWDDGLTDFQGNNCDDCDPIWTAERICRGNMDYILGYGNEWSALRQWPCVEEENLPDYMESTAYIPSYIESKERAYFNFEHDEIVGQPNWDVYKGKPMYHVTSYEEYYDAGSIGRSLSFDEWRESQAWQAFGAYETICKCRWLDYDGLSWCNLRGGQNTGTYQKSIVDYCGQAKIAYYAHRMAFQDVLACSGNVDIVYGPDDKIPVSVLNLGDGKTVSVVVEVSDRSGRIVFVKDYFHVSLPAGRNKLALDELELPELPDGIYSVDYKVYG